MLVSLLTSTWPCPVKTCLPGVSPPHEPVRFLQQPAYGGYGAAAGYGQPYGAPAAAAAYPGYGAPAAYPGYGAPAADPYAQVSLAVHHLHARLPPSLGHV